MKPSDIPPEFLQAPPKPTGFLKDARWFLFATLSGLAFILSLPSAGLAALAAWVLPDEYNNIG